MKRDVRGPLISIVVPVYNVGDYLAPCLDSILAQTYRHYEAILIDDGSTDGSGKLCEEYASRDARFRVIHKNNGGLANTRMKGLELAQGDYIVFIDADDRVGATHLEQLLAPFCADETVDVSIGRVIYVNLEGTKKSAYPSHPPQALSQVEALKTLVNPALGRWFVVAKMYRSNVFDKVHWNERITAGEDFDGTWQAFQNIRKGYYTDVGDYFYIERPSSISHLARCEETVWHYRNFWQAMHSSIAIANDDLQRVMQERFIADYYAELQRAQRSNDPYAHLFYLEFHEVFFHCLVEVLPEWKLRDRFLCRFAGPYEAFLEDVKVMFEMILQGPPLYIYGAGAIARRVAQSLTERGIPYKGFVVSDGEVPQLSPDGKSPVLSLSEVPEKQHQFFMGINWWNIMKVLPSLEDRGESIWL